MERFYAINIFETVKINMKFSSKEKYMKIVRTLFFSKHVYRRVRIVYRGLGRAFVVHKNRDLEVNNFLGALGLVCIVMSSQHGVAVFL